MPREGEGARDGHRPVKSLHGGPPTRRPHQVSHKDAGRIVGVARWGLAESGAWQDEGVPPSAPDQTGSLLTALDRVGYYPAEVAAAVEDSLAGEDVVSYVIHHEPTFDRDEVRRHITVLVLTPRPHADHAHGREPAGRPASAALHVDLDGGDPAGQGRQRRPSPGWSRSSRTDAGSPNRRSPRLCWPSGGARCPGSTWSRPSAATRSVVADHGYTGALTSEDFSLRISATADGGDAVRAAARLLPSAERSDRQRRHLTLSRAGSELVQPAYGSGSLAEVVRSALAAMGVDGWSNVLGLPDARSYVILLVDGLGWHLLRRHASSAPYLSSLADRGRAITAGVPSTTATSLTSLGTGLPARAARCRRLHLTDPRHRTGYSTPCKWDCAGGSAGVAAAPDGVRAGGNGRGAGECREQADVRGLRPHEGRRNAERRISARIWPGSGSPPRSVPRTSPGRSPMCTTETSTRPATGTAASRRPGGTS